MLQEQETRAWPTTAAGTSATLSAYFYSRQTEGTGLWGASNVPSTLAIVYPNGRTDLRSVAVLRDTIIQHAMNSSALSAWWSPRSTTIEAALRAALSSWVPRAFDASSGVQVFFDGQFGPVLVA